LATWHNHSGIFDQKRTVSFRLMWGLLSGGRTSLLLPPATENTSYATNLDAITFTVCTALNADFAPMHQLQPFHSVNKFSDSTPVRSAC